MATSRAEQISGVSHTQCFKCGAFCRSHAHHLLHLASSHPALLDSAPAGRLGLVFLYQASGKLFHCNICLYTSRDFTQVWQHLLRNHCVDQEQTKVQIPGTKPGLNQDPGTKPGLNQDPETKPGLNQDPETKPGLNLDPETKPGLNLDPETKPGLNQDPETKPGLNQNPETKPALNQIPETKPGLNQDPGRESETKQDKETRVKQDQEPGPGADLGDVEMKCDGEREQQIDKEKEAVEPMDTEDHSLQKGSDGPQRCPSPETCGLLRREGSGPYRCSICSWSHKLRSIAVNHVVRKHDSPRHLYDVPIPEPEPSAAAPDSAPATLDPAPAEEEEEVTTDTMRQELEATKILRFSGHHVICELCGWKAKIRKGTRGFAQSHLERCHDLKKSFECTICGQAFFMSYRLRDHMRLSHRPGKYRCLFCVFRSDNLSGFRRHSGKCNFKDQDEDRDQDHDQDRIKPEPEEEHERILRPKRRTSRMILDEDED